MLIANWLCKGNKWSLRYMIFNIENCNECGVLCSYISKNTCVDIRTRPVYMRGRNLDINVPSADRVLTAKVYDISFIFSIDFGRQNLKHFKEDVNLVQRGFSLNCHVLSRNNISWYQFNQHVNNQCNASFITWNICMSAQTKYLAHWKLSSSPSIPLDVIPCKYLYITSWTLAEICSHKKHYTRFR